MTMLNGMRRTGRRRFIESYEFSPALHRKLRDELGGTREADIALEGLRAWYLACLYADCSLIGMPSKAVDEAWHEMILMTRDYTEFCDRAFGRYLHHTPDSVLGVSMHDLLGETLRVVDDNELPMTLFTADADAGMEDGHTYSSTDLRRMRDANASWSPHRPHGRRRATTSDGSASGWWAGGFFFGGGDGSGGGGDGGGGAAAGVADAEAAAEEVANCASEGRVRVELVPEIRMKSTRPSRIAGGEANLALP